MKKANRSVLFFVLYSFNGASSRYRVYQYLPFLKEQGVLYRVYPFYTQRFESVSGRCSALHPLLGRAFSKLYAYYGYLKRFAQILTAPRYDTVFIQKELLPAFLLGLLCRLHKNVIFDFDDAIFLSEEQQKGIFGRVMLKRSRPQIDAILQRARSVTVGNRFIGSYAGNFCPRITMIPIAIDMDRYALRGREESGRIVFGWVGRQRNAYYIDDLAEVFGALSREFPGRLKLLIIGAQKVSIDSIEVDYRPWSYDSEIEDLGDIDIGLMPLRDEDWSRGKGGCKLLQYMAAGIPTVSSPVGINSEIVTDGQDGFLASGDAEWVEKLSRLVRDPGLRREIGRRARETVREKYSLDKWQKVFLDTLLGSERGAAI